MLAPTSRTTMRPGATQKRGAPRPRRQLTLVCLTFDLFLENTMNSSIINKLSLAVALLSPLAFGVGCSQSGSIGTSREVAHSESDKTGWFGGQTHAENTVYKNSDGSTSVETQTTTTKGDTTTIVRDKKTTFADGSVKTDHETRTIVKGTDNVERETSSSN
jgi:hypothetical protein